MSLWIYNHSPWIDNAKSRHSFSFTISHWLSGTYPIIIPFYWVIWITWSQEHWLIWGFTQQSYPDNPVNLLLIYFTTFVFCLKCIFETLFVSTLPEANNIAFFMNTILFLNYINYLYRFISDFSWRMLCYVKAQEQGNVRRKKREADQQHSFINSL